MRLVPLAGFWNSARLVLVNILSFLVGAFPAGKSGTMKGIFQCCCVFAAFIAMLLGGVSWLMARDAYWTYNTDKIELAAEYDFVIIGAGSAGCVLANRLSENPNVTVLLLVCGCFNDDYYIHV